MSLNWDCTKVRDKQEVLEGTEWLKANAIIFSTMAIDMGQITEKNVDEFYARYKGLEFAIKNTVAEGVTVTRADIARRVGLSTNVATRTRAQYLKRLGEMIMRDIDREVKQEREAAG